GAPTIVVATKVDKLGSVVAAQRITALSESLGLDAEQVVAFSAKTGEGRDTLAIALNELLLQPAWRVVETAEDEVDGEPGADISNDVTGTKPEQARLAE
ncbi:MAG: hypothetical protein ABJC26_12350, partial [Gemmatimonadaceae bacterium]